MSEEAPASEVDSILEDVSFEEFSVSEVDFFSVSEDELFCEKLVSKGVPVSDVISVSVFESESEGVSVFISEEV